MRSTSSRFAVVGVVIALGMVAAACSGGDSSPDSADGGDGPAMGGEMTYAVEAGNSGGWCLPEAQLALAGIQMGKAIYEPLTAPNVDGEYVPFLAESFTPNDDFTEWTVTLREGIKFHDGTDLNAEVVKNNIDAYRGQYPTRNALLFAILLADIESVTVIDELTLVSKTKTPWVSTPAYLHGGGRLGIMAQAQLDDVDNCDSNLIGTGPFALEDWVPNDHFTATKFADYWQTDSDGTQLPYLDKITFRPTIDPDAKLNALLSGQMDIALFSGPQEELVLIDEAEAGNVDTYSTDQFSDLGFFMFNTGIEPFDNMDARLAITQGFDREDFNQVLNFDLPQLASGPFPPGNMGYLDDAGFPEHNLDEAKAAAARYTEATGKPLKFTLNLANDAGSSRAGQYFQAAAAKIGAEVELVAVEQAALINSILSGNWDAVLWRNHAGGDPDLENPWWNSTSPVNFGKFQDAEVDSLLAAGRSEPDPAIRTEIYEELNARLNSQVYNLWLNWTPWMVANQPGISGILGPDLPDGSAPFPGLASGNPVSSLAFPQ